MNKKNILKAFGAASALLLTTLLATSCNSGNKNATDTSVQEQPEVTEETLKALAAALPQYSGVSSFHDGLAIVCDKETDLYGCIDQTGTLVIPCQYQYILYDFHDGVTVATTTDYENIIIDREGNTIAPYPYGNEGFCGFEEGLIPFVQFEQTASGETDWEQPAKVGYLDTKGKVVIPATYEYILAESSVASHFSEGLSPQYKYDDESVHTTFIDKTGRGVFTCKGRADDFHEGLTLLGKDLSTNEDDFLWRYGFLDKKGKEAIPFRFERAGHFSEGLCWAEEGDKKGFIGKDGKFVLTGPWHIFTLDEGGAEEEDLIPTFSEGLAWVCNSENKFGYIDKTGTLVIPYRYEVGYNDIDERYDQQPCFDFHQGIARVLDKSTGKYGYIDKEGNEVQPCQFDDAYDMSEGLALVRRGDDWGYINARGICTLDIKE